MDLMKSDHSQEWMIDNVVPMATGYGLAKEYEYLKSSIREFLTGKELEKLALCSKAIKFLEKWNSSFGIHYRQLRLLLDCQCRRIFLPPLCPGNLIRMFLATNEILIYLVLHISCIILI
ncbi:uncharacterized protein LOC133879631 [Alnus glutinosa]|uniref:uncharacterized protein LOC133879631 n=1 Tax=Alnus glutinosa TaxID=3517 RepID=UPI002D79A421|nr:uncharacterized protein LOC133879631 [Alnus glutinosa]